MHLTAARCARPGARTTHATSPHAGGMCAERWRVCGRPRVAWSVERGRADACDRTCVCAAGASPRRTERAI
eukprot:776528-Prymnesium_polylepis.2